MNRSHFIVSWSVWRALDECAVGGDLHRGQLLDCIKIGHPVRGPLGGWGYSDGDNGSMQFATAGHAHLALGLIASDTLG